MQFLLDKSNKVPLYLQLKDQIKYFISTGAISAQDQLPPVKSLSRELSINFLTVRKAYQELEREGLVDIRHGEGTFITLSDVLNQKIDGQDGNGSNPGDDAYKSFAGEFSNVVERYLRQGMDLSEAKDIAQEVFDKVEKRKSLPAVIFTECNQFQISEISALLERELELDVTPMLISDLGKNLPDLVGDKYETHIITTGFHVNEVRNSVGDLPVKIDVLITNLNPGTRRKLESVGEKGKFCFICRDQESAVLYNDLLKAELGFKEMSLTCCTLSETERLRDLIETSDVILASPPVYEEVKKLAQPEKIVYNVFERVDPMSLKVIRDRIRRT